jgi:hypothetical protein
MAPINIVAHELESHGVRTFSAKEMAFNILGIMHPLLFSIAWARLKRVQTMRPASFDSYVVFFKNSNLCFISYLGSIDFLNEGKGWFGLRRRKLAQTRHVWAIGEFFFFLLSCFVYSKFLTNVLCSI